VLKDKSKPWEVLLENGALCERVFVAIETGVNIAGQPTNATYRV
jgi:hypothetical protein